MSICMTNLDKWRYYLKDVPSPDSYIEWSFYFLITACLQRRVWIGSEWEPIFPNMYVILTGPPATGKGRVIKPVIEILKCHKLHERNKEDTKGLTPEEMLTFIRENMETSPTNTKTGKIIEEPLLFPVAPESVTFEALVRLNAQSVRRINVPKGSATKLAPNGIYMHQSMTFCLEEMSSLFKKQADAVVKYLIVAYDCGSYDYITKNQGEDRIRKPCLSFMVGTTPSFLESSFDEKLLDEGFASRTVFVFESGPRFHRFMRPDLESEQIAAFNDIVAHTKKLSRLFGQVTYAPEAHEYLRQYLEEVQPKKKANNSLKLEPYYGRKNLHCHKLALALHFADQCEDMVIQRDIAVRVVESFEKVEERMHLALCNIGRGMLGTYSVKVRRMLHNQGPLTYYDIWRSFEGEVRDEELREVLSYLERTEQIGRIELEGKSRYILITVKKQETPKDNEPPSST